MSDPDEMDEFRRWVEVFNKTHGYGSVFNYETAADKVIVQLGSAREFCKSIATELGLTTVGEPEHNPNDPPDCYIFVEEQRLGVELVQLIDSEHKRRAAKGETPYAGQLFLDMQWSRDRLISKLNGMIQTKGTKYERAGMSIDVLLIHTAETWLNSNQVREWLADVQIKPHPNFASAFLLLEYEPGKNAQHWPVFLLYGGLEGRASRGVAWERKS
ncbi:MAG: hypothetical protein ACM3TN_19090 [Alphaproteobacteria bacterium]